MALVNHSFTALINTDSDGDNTIAAQAVSVKNKSDATFANIFSDEAGTSPIVQPGAVTDSNGVLEFWVVPGVYLIESGSRNEIETINRFVNTIILPTMEDLLALQSFNLNGQKAEINGYLTEGIGGGTFYWDAAGDKTEHDGGVTIDPDVALYSLIGTQLQIETSVNLWYGTGVPAGTGVWRRLNVETVIDDWYGPLTNATWVFNEGFVNRKLYEKMLRNTNANDFEFAPKDNPVFIWGSIHPLRSDMTIRHLAGCDIRGRYSDPAELATGQAGHMWGFVNYVDPYPGTDFTNAGQLQNINYILDGTASTIFDAGHSSLHNNNVFGFFNTEDCSVTGTGGVTASDHNGVAFDGDCVNPLVDISYIKNYDDRAVTMKGTAGTNDSARVIVGTLKGATQAGSVGESILVADFTYCYVFVGDAFLNLSPLGTFVKGLDTKKLVVECGYIVNAQFFCAIEDVSEVHISNVRYDNVTNFVRRGGTSPAPTPLKLIALDNIVCESTVNAKLYLSQVTVGPFNELRVVNCDFEGGTRSFTLYSGIVGTSTPDIFNIKNNRAPKTLTGTHDGAGNAAVLTDTTQTWLVNEHFGKTLNNDTDGSTTTVTANTATTITGVLSGGTDDDWDVSDAYTIIGGWVDNANIWNEQGDRPNVAVGGSSFTYDTVGTNRDRPYSTITVIMTHSSSSHRYPLEINLRDLFLTAADYRQSATADDGSIMEISTVRTGTSVLFTFTVTGGSGTISSYSLGN